MKIISKISLCSLLISIIGGTNNLEARKWTPAEAERRAKTGDFDAADTEQLLADLPQEWKRLNRRLVKEIQEGRYHRGERKKKKIGQKSKVIETENPPLFLVDDFSTSDSENDKLELKPLNNSDEDVEKIILEEDDKECSKYKKSQKIDWDPLLRLTNGDLNRILVTGDIKSNNTTINDLVGALIGLNNTKYKFKNGRKILACLEVLAEQHYCEAKTSTDAQENTRIIKKLLEKFSTYLENFGEFFSKGIQLEGTMEKLNGLFS